MNITLSQAGMKPITISTESGQGFDLSNSHVDENGNWTSNPNVNNINPASQDFVNQAAANQRAAYDADIADRVKKEKAYRYAAYEQAKREFNDAKEAKQQAILDVDKQTMNGVG